MDLTGFTDEQKKALADLLTLGMYADGNLDLIEDEKARSVLNTIEFTSESARQYFIDDSFTRARRYGDSTETTRKYVAKIAKNFTATPQRRQVYNILEDSLSSDRQIADKECELLTIVSEEFGL